MNYSKLTTSEIDITPWGDQTPKKSLLPFALKPRPSFSKVSKTYRPRTNQTASKRPRKKDITIRSIVFSAPLKNNAFPVRNISSPARIIRKSMNRSRSYVSDQLSLTDIENIERKQRLIPYQISFSIGIKNNSEKNTLNHGRKDSLISIGIVKENRIQYKKYVKQG